MAKAETRAPTELKTLFNAEVIEDLAERLTLADASFDAAGFRQAALQGLDALELKARSAHLCEAMAPRLPKDFEEAVGLLIEALGEADGTGGVEGFEAFRFLPFLDYVAAYGLDSPGVALDAMERMTLHFSAEFTIRPFILRYPDQTMKRLNAWAKNKDWRVRRLASEGSRPRLPWGQRLRPFVDDPSAVIEILDQLHGDPHLVVRRSVANNLNDIAKDHPDLAAETAMRWAKTGDELTQWTVRHGLRSLVKQGHSQALAVLGYTGGEHIRVEQLTIEPNRVAIGKQLDFSFQLVSAEAAPTRIMVDYALHRVLASGKRARKVFKLAKSTLDPSDQKDFAGRLRFKQLSTRTYYPGRHSLEIIINGRSSATLDFTVT